MDLVHKDNVVVWDSLVPLAVLELRVVLDHQVNEVLPVTLDSLDLKALLASLGDLVQSDHLVLQDLAVYLAVLVLPVCLVFKAHQGLKVQLVRQNIFSVQSKRTSC